MSEEDAKKLRREPLAGEEDVCCRKAGFVRNDADKLTGSRFTLVCAFSCAGNGILHTLRTQRNMKIHSALAVLAVVLGLILALDAMSWAAIVLCMAAVFAAECFNTAIEAVVDLVSPDYHELARHAKDCAAGAVLLCALAAVVVALLVFAPRLWALIAG